MFREPIAIRPASLVASAEPDDQHGWKRVWSKQLLVLCAVNTQRVPNAVYEPRNSTTQPAKLAGQLAVRSPQTYCSFTRKGFSTLASGSNCERPV